MASITPAACKGTPIVLTGAETGNDLGLSLIIIIQRAGPVMEHSHIQGSSPLFAILHSSPCRVQANAECTQIFLNGSCPCLSGSVT